MDAEVRDFFRSSDVLEITDVIRSASDEELRALIDLDHFRAEAVVAILDRFAEFADAGGSPRSTAWCGSTSRAPARTTSGTRPGSQGAR